MINHRAVDGETCINSGAVASDCSPGLPLMDAGLHFATVTVDV